MLWCVPFQWHLAHSVISPEMKELEQLPQYHPEQRTHNIVAQLSLVGDADDSDVWMVSHALDCKDPCPQLMQFLLLSDL